MIIQSGIEIYSDIVGATVRFTVRPSSRSLTARWRSGKLYVNVPPLTTLESIEPVLRRLAPSIEAKRPTLVYSDGMEIKLDGISFVITRERSISHGRLMVQQQHDCMRIFLAEDTDFNSNEVTVAISNAMCAAARHIAADLLLPRAVGIAENLGVKPHKWKISNGHRVLGHCSAAREIALSYVNVFLPADLRDYIICHELAHLSEMNHSERFHALCDRYCRGQERDMIRKLRRYNWPIIRK